MARQLISIFILFLLRFFMYRCRGCLKQANRRMNNQPTNQKNVYLENKVRIDVTHLEGERRRRKRRPVIVEIQHFDLKLADAFFGRPALVFG